MFNGMDETMGLMVVDKKLSELSDMSTGNELLPFYDAIERSAAASDENDA